MNNLKGKILLPFIAPPNGGKGTQTVALSQYFNIPKVDMGGMLRETAKENTPLALIVRETQAKGQLVSLDIVMQVLEHGLRTIIEKNPTVPAFILDGFPRNLAQAEKLMELCEKEGAVIKQVFYLEVPDDIITERAINRRFCETCGEIYNLTTKPPKTANLCDIDAGPLYQRNDDMPDKVKVRLQSFAEETMPLIDFFEQKGLLAIIDGNRPVADVQADLIKAIAPLIGSVPA